MSSAPSVDPQDYPPYTMTDAQAAATVGRYQEDVTAAPAPRIKLEEYEHEFAAGRTPAAPPGTVYVGDVYDQAQGDEVSAHAASVAAYPANVRSSVPDAIDPSTPGVQEAQVANEAESYAPTHLDIIAEAAEAKAQDEAEAADEAADAVDEAAANDAVVPELDDAAAAKDRDAAIAEGVAAAAAEAAAANAETGVDVANAEPAKAPPNYAELTVAELRSELGKRGVEYEYSARKSDLIALLQSTDG